MLISTKLAVLKKVISYSSLSKLCIYEGLWRYLSNEKKVLTTLIMLSISFNYKVKIFYNSFSSFIMNTVWKEIQFLKK